MTLSTASARRPDRTDSPGRHDRHDHDRHDRHGRHVRHDRHARRRTGRATAAGAAVMLTLIAALASCAGPEIDTAALAAQPVPPEHADGAALYQQHCVVCHGPHGTGTDQAPPLVHPVYRTRHHGDEAFQLAVAQGVRAHHFRFGDMPPVPGLSRDEVTAITGYVRWLQRTAGVD